MEMPRSENCVAFLHITNLSLHTSDRSPRCGNPLNQGRMPVFALIDGQDNAADKLQQEILLFQVIDRFGTVLVKLRQFVGG